MKVEKGKKVKVEYEGTFDDGTVFDSSKQHGKPLEFLADEGQVVPGFDKAVLDMEINQEKEFTIQPDEAYGQLNPELKKEVPKDQLPEGQEPKVGMMLAVGMPNGQQVPALITQVTDTSVTIDLNHPLAGKVLHFKIKLLEISEATEEDKKSGCGDDSCSDSKCGPEDSKRKECGNEEKKEAQGGECCGGGCE